MIRWGLGTLTDKEALWPYGTPGWYLKVKGARSPVDTIAQ